MDNRKRVLVSRDIDIRKEEARRLLDEKKLSYTPPDHAKAYVACYNCIKYGFKTGRQQILHQRYKLNEHYSKHHPSEVVQEWNFSSQDSNKRQKTLPFFSVDHTAHDTDKGEPSGAEQPETLPEEEETFVHDISPLQDSGLMWNTVKSVWETVKLMWDAVKSIQSTGSNSYKLLKMVVEKHRLRSPLLEDYGPYASLEGNEVKLDQERLKADLKSCNTAIDIFRIFPFLGLNETEDKIICSFCPGTELSFYPDKDVSSHRFGNTKMILKGHLMTNSHLQSVLKDIKEQNIASNGISRDEKAARIIFRTVYGCTKRGYSFECIIREISLLHYHGVNVGNINHSKETIKKIKDVLAQVLRSRVRKILSTPLDATGQLRPLSEVFDKMTHNGRTGQMQVVIAPLVSKTQLLTPIYLDNYLTNPGYNQYKDMVEMVRETGDSYYDQKQVENASADGAYAKSENTQKMYVDSLGLQKTGWVDLQWDYAHSLDLAEGDAREKIESAEEALDLAQGITKCFRWGKNYSAIRPEAEVDTCVSLYDITSDTHEPTPGQKSITLKPVIRSSLKFAAHGQKFLKNYVRNLPHYIKRMNDIINDNKIQAKQREKIRGYLGKINVKHVVTIFGLLDVYCVISKAQHGLSKVNQFPWEYVQRVQHLSAELGKIEDDSFEGELKKAEPNLVLGVFPGGTLITTEQPRITRGSSNSSSLEDDVKQGKSIVVKFVAELKKNLEARITESQLLRKINSVFHEWNEGELESLLKIANDSGRNYGDFDKLKPQYMILKERFRETQGLNEMNKWLAMFTKKNLFSEIPDILHFALCAFMKCPLEAIVESLGSVINRHGSENRGSLLPASLSNEVQLSWNGPNEFDYTTDSIIEEAVKLYFIDKQTGPRFYVRNKLRIASSTVLSHMEKPSRLSGL